MNTVEYNSSEIEKRKIMKRKETEKKEEKPVKLEMDSTVEFERNS